MSDRASANDIKEEDVTNIPYSSPSSLPSFPPFYESTFPSPPPLTPINPIKAGDEHYMFMIGIVVANIMSPPIGMGLAGIYGFGSMLDAYIKYTDEVPQSNPSLPTTMSTITMEATNDMVFQSPESGIKYIGMGDPISLYNTLYTDQRAAIVGGAFIGLGHVIARNNGLRFNPRGGALSGTFYFAYQFGSRYIVSTLKTKVYGYVFGDDRDDNQEHLTGTPEAMQAYAVNGWISSYVLTNDNLILAANIITGVDNNIADVYGLVDYRNFNLMMTSMRMAENMVRRIIIEKAVEVFMEAGRIAPAFADSVLTTLTTTNTPDNLVNTAIENAQLLTGGVEDGVLAEYDMFISQAVLNNRIPVEEAVPIVNLVHIHQFQHMPGNFWNMATQMMRYNMRFNIPLPMAIQNFQVRAIPGLLADGTTAGFVMGANMVNRPYQMMTMRNIGFSVAGTVIVYGGINVLDYYKVFNPIKLRLAGQFPHWYTNLTMPVPGRARIGDKEEEVKEPSNQLQITYNGQLVSNEVVQKLMIGMRVLDQVISGIRDEEEEEESAVALPVTDQTNDYIKQEIMKWCVNPANPFMISIINDNNLSKQETYDLCLAGIDLYSLEKNGTIGNVTLDIAPIMDESKENASITEQPFVGGFTPASYPNRDISEQPTMEWIGSYFPGGTSTNDVVYNVTDAKHRVTNEPTFHTAARTLTGMIYGADDGFEKGEKIIEEIKKVEEPLTEVAATTLEATKMFLDFGNKLKLYAFHISATAMVIIGLIVLNLAMGPLERVVNVVARVGGSIVWLGTDVYNRLPGRRNVVPVIRHESTERTGRGMTSTLRSGTVGSSTPSASSISSTIPAPSSSSLASPIILPSTSTPGMVVSSALSAPSSSVPSLRGSIASIPKVRITDPGYVENDDEYSSRPTRTTVKNMLDSGNKGHRVKLPGWIEETDLHGDVNASYSEFNPEPSNFDSSSSSVQSSTSSLNPTASYRYNKLSTSATINNLNAYSLTSKIANLQSSSDILVTSPSDAPIPIYDNKVIEEQLNAIMTKVKKKTEDINAETYTNIDKAMNILDENLIYLTMNKKTYEHYFNLRKTSDIVLRYNMFEENIKNKKRVLEERKNKKSTAASASTKPKYTEEEKQWFKKVRNMLESINTELIALKIKYGYWSRPETLVYNINGFCEDLDNLAMYAKRARDLITEKRDDFENKSLTKEIDNLNVIEVTCRVIVNYFRDVNEFWTTIGVVNANDITPSLNITNDNDATKKVARDTIQYQMKEFKKLQNVKDIKLGLDMSEENIIGPQTSTGYKVWQHGEVTEWHQAHVAANILNMRITDHHDNLKLRFVQSKVLSGNSLATGTNHYGFLYIMIDKLKTIMNMYENNVMTATSLDESSFHAIKLYMDEANEFITEYENDINNVILILDDYESVASVVVNTVKLNIGAKVIKNLFLYRKHGATEFTGENILPDVIAKCIAQVLRVTDLTRIPLFRAIEYGYQALEAFISQIRNEARRKKSFDLFAKVVDTCYKQNRLIIANHIVPVPVNFEPGPIVCLRDSVLLRRVDLDRKALVNNIYTDPVNTIPGADMNPDIIVMDNTSFNIPSYELWKALKDIILTIHRDGQPGSTLRDNAKRTPAAIQRFVDKMKFDLNIKVDHIDQFLRRLYLQIIYVFDGITELADRSDTATCEGGVLMSRFRMYPLMAWRAEYVNYPNDNPNNMALFKGNIVTKNRGRDDIYKESFDEFYILDRILLVPTSYSECFISDIIGPAFFCEKVQLHAGFLRRMREIFELRKDQTPPYENQMSIFINRSKCFGNGYVKFFIYNLHKWLFDNETNRKEIFEKTLEDAYGEEIIVQPQPLPEYSVYKVLRLLGYQQREGRIIVSIDTMKLPLVSHVPTSIYKYSMSNPTYNADNLRSRNYKNPAFTPLEQVAKEIMTDIAMKNNRLYAAIKNGNITGHMVGVTERIEELRPRVYAIIGQLVGGVFQGYLDVDTLRTEDEITQNMDTCKDVHNNTIEIIKLDREMVDRIQQYANANLLDAAIRHDIENYRRLIGEVVIWERRLRAIFEELKQRYILFRQVRPNRYLGMIRVYDAVFNRYSTMTLNN